MAPESSSSSTGRGGLGPRSSSYAGLLDLIQRHWAGGASPPRDRARARRSRDDASVSPRAASPCFSRQTSWAASEATDTDFETASEGDEEDHATLFPEFARLRADDDDAREEDRPARRRPPAPPDRAAAHWSAECDLASWLVVRGAKYLRDRVKVASAPPAMECVGVDLFSFDDAPHAHVAERRPESWLRRRRAERANRASRANEKPPPWTFVFQFMNPGPPYVSIACYFRPAGERAGMSLDALLAHDRDTPFGRTLRRFLDASDRERDAKFKMVAALTKAPWALRSAVPRRPVILGKKLASGLRYFRGEDHFEVDFELARNAFMDRAYRSLKWASERSEEEIVFLLEGQAEDELPERVLGAVALARVGEAALTKLPPLRAAEEGGGSPPRTSAGKPAGGEGSGG